MSDPASPVPMPRPEADQDEKSEPAEEEKKDDAASVQQLQAQVAELTAQVEARDKQLAATNRVKAHLQRENRRLLLLQEQQDTATTNTTTNTTTPLTVQQEDALREEPVYVEALPMRLREAKPRTSQDYVKLLHERDALLQRMTVQVGLQRKQLRKHEDYIAGMKSPQQVLDHAEQLQQALAQARQEQIQQLDDLLKLVTPNAMTSISLDDDLMMDDGHASRSCSSALFVQANIQSKYDELVHALRDFLKHASPEQVQESALCIQRLNDQVDQLNTQLSATERQAFNKDTKLQALEQELADVKLAHDQLQQRLGFFLQADSNPNDPDNLQQLYAHTQQLEKERDHAIHKHVHAHEALMEAQQTIEMLQLQIEKQVKNFGGTATAGQKPSSTRAIAAVVSRSITTATPSSIITNTKQSAEDLRRHASELLSQADFAHTGSLRGERTSRSRPTHTKSHTTTTTSPTTSPTTTTAAANITGGWGGLGGSLRGERSARSRNAAVLQQAFGDHDAFGRNNNHHHHRQNTKHDEQLGTDSERGGGWGSRLRNFKRSLMEEHGS